MSMATLLCWHGQLPPSRSPHHLSQTSIPDPSSHHRTVPCPSFPSRPTPCPCHQCSGFGTWAVGLQGEEKTSARPEKRRRRAARGRCRGGARAARGAVTHAKSGGWAAAFSCPTFLAPFWWLYGNASTPPCQHFSPSFYGTPPCISCFRAPRHFSSLSATVTPFFILQVSSLVLVRPKPEMTGQIAQRVDYSSS